MAIKALPVVFALILAAPLFGQVTFTEVSTERGISGYSMAVGSVGGLAAFDYDNDGDIDVFVPNGEGLGDLLWQNDGSGNFSNVAAAAGLASTANHRAAIWLDFDNDRLPDLLVGGDCRTEPLSDTPCSQTENLRLYRQLEDHTFVDVTNGTGLEQSWGGTGEMHRSGLVAGDINQDGFLDIYVSNWNGRAWLYRNNRDGTFTDITLSSGMSDQFFPHHQPVMHDFNGDGWLDLYVAVDLKTPNFLWINQQDETFVDQSAAAGVDNAMTDMGIALGDYDNDQDMDLYVTNITRLGEHNVLYRNDTVGQELAFSEVSQELGVAQGYWGWGATFLDADNDGWLDIAATNGKNVGQWRDDPSLFYLNNADIPVTFTNVSNEVMFNDTNIASGLIAFDADRDGDLDLMQTAQETASLQFMDNTRGTVAADHHYLVVRPRMNNVNHFAIGAEIHVTAGSMQLMRVIRTATSILGQEPAEAFFGLGDQSVVDQVRIVWPNGTESSWTDVAADQVITLTSEPGFQINAGLNDAWYDPATPGQGFFVTVFPEIRKVFVAWFTYDTVRPSGSVTADLGGPGQRWLTAFGDFSDGQAVLDVEFTDGGVFDSAAPSPQQSFYGNIELEFTGCNAGTIRYDLAGLELQGIVPIQRIALDNVARCEAAQASATD